MMNELSVINIFALFYDEGLKSGRDHAITTDVFMPLL